MNQITFARFTQTSRWLCMLVLAIVLTACVRSEDGLDNGANPPTAYFCSTDVLAISTMRVLVRMGKRVPDDVSVTGFDGISIGEWLTPSLATAVQPAGDMGEWAAKHLLGRINHKEPVTNLVLPYRIRPGESWGPVSTSLRVGQRA